MSENIEETQYNYIRRMKTKQESRKEKAKLNNSTVQRMLIYD